MVGDKVEANYRGRGKFYAGKIKRDREDGTYDIDYDDGESETKVKEELIRLIDGGGGLNRSSRERSPPLGHSHGHGRVRFIW